MMGKYLDILRQGRPQEGQPKPPLAHATKETKETKHIPATGRSAITNHRDTLCLFCRFCRKCRRGFGGAGQGADRARSPLPCPRRCRAVAAGGRGRSTVPHDVGRAGRITRLDYIRPVRSAPGPRPAAPVLPPPEPIRLHRHGLVARGQIRHRHLEQHGGNSVADRRHHKISQGPQAKLRAARRQLGLFPVTERQWGESAGHDELAVPTSLDAAGRRGLYVRLFGGVNRIGITPLNYKAT